MAPRPKFQVGDLVKWNLMRAGLRAGHETFRVLMVERGECVVRREPPEHVGVIRQLYAGPVGDYRRCRDVGVIRALDPIAEQLHDAPGGGA